MRWCVILLHEHGEFFQLLSYVPVEHQGVAGTPQTLNFKVSMEGSSHFLQNMFGRL